MKSHQSSLSAWAWVTVSALFISVLTLALCVLEHAASSLALKSRWWQGTEVERGIGVVAVGNTLPFPPIHTHSHTNPNNAFVFVIFPVPHPPPQFSLIFSPSSICWGWKGFNFRSNRCSLARNVAAYCSHKEQGCNVCVGPGVKCYLSLLSLSGHTDSLHSQALGTTGIVLICCREHGRVW